MRIVIAGASGLIGHALTAALRARGHDVRRLVRRAVSSPDEIAWDPGRRVMDDAAFQDTDAVINLAGENIAAGRWTTRRRDSIRRSRIDATLTLVDGIRRLSRRPAVLVNASAVGCYGDRGDEMLTEASDLGGGFLADVCREWEAAAMQAAALGVRTACLRFGVVLAPDGGALAKMLPLFRLGLGGRLGSGRQWMSWVHRDDVVGVVEHALAEPRCAGPINVVAPEPVRNDEFTRALASRLHRPAFLPVPAAALQLVFGRMADEALLASTRALPARLRATTYAFRYPELPGALDAVLAGI